MNLQTAIIYCRVSTKGQEKYGVSLENQEEACREYCKSNNIQILGVFKEAFTGKKTSRPILDEAILNAKENKANFFIIFDIDRFSREGYEFYAFLKRELKNSGIELKDSKNIIQEETVVIHDKIVDISQYAWNKACQSEYAEVILATVAKEEGKKILQRTIPRKIQLEQEGYCVLPANFGFKNDKLETSIGKRPIQTRFEDEAKWIDEMYKLRGEKLLSDKEIVEGLNLKGFKTRGNSYYPAQPLCVRYFLELIRNPIYAGVKNSKWTGGKCVKTAYPGLVSIETWNKANTDKYKIIEDGENVFVEELFKPAPKIKRNLNCDNYIFLGKIKYAGKTKDGKEVIKPMRAYLKGGNVYYREGQGVLPRINIPQKSLIEKFIEELPMYSLPEFLRKDFTDGLLERFEELNGTIIKDTKKIQKEINDLFEESKNIAKSSIKGDIDREIAKSIQEENSLKIAKLKAELAKQEASQTILNQEVDELYEIFTNSQKFWDEGDLYQKKTLIKMFVDELELVRTKDNKKQLHIKNTELFDTIYKINYYLEKECGDYHDKLN